MRRVEGTPRLFVERAGRVVATDAPLGLSLDDDVYLCLPAGEEGIEQLIDRRGVVHPLVAAQWTAVAMVPDQP